jgi:anti-sigma B factor antagonist
MIHPSETPPRAPFAVGISTQSGELSLQVRGELDLATAPQLARCLRELQPNADRVCLDLTGVSFLDLSGLRVLLDARRDAGERGAQLRVVPGEAARRLCELTRTTHLLDPH